MSWARLDDGFWMHPKVLISGNAAAGVFARLLSYSGCYLTDGLIPSPIVDSIVGKDKRAIDALVTHGMVHRMDTGSIYIPDYLEYNPSKIEVEKVVQQRKAAGKASAAARSARGRTHA